MSPESPAVAAVVVAWNSRAEVLNCLAALAAGTRPVAAVIVVDNASTDGTAAAVRAAYPAAEVLAQDRNGHFAWAANVGLARAAALGAAYAWVLNPDATPAPEALEEMVRVMQSDPAIGFVGARLEHPARGGQPARVIVGAHCDFATGLVSEPPPPADPALDQLAVDYVWGAAMLIRLAVVAQVGAFDARLVAYFEDADLCLRARALGWRTVTALHARVAHVGSSVGDTRYLNQMWLRGRNWLRVFWRHAPPRQRPRLLAWMLAYRLPLFAWATVRGAIKRRGRR